MDMDHRIWECLGLHRYHSLDLALGMDEKGDGRYGDIVPIMNLNAPLGYSDRRVLVEEDLEGIYVWNPYNHPKGWKLETRHFVGITQLLRYENWVEEALNAPGGWSPAWLPIGLGTLSGKQFCRVITILALPEPNLDWQTCDSNLAQCTEAEPPPEPYEDPDCLRPETPTLPSWDFLLYVKRN